MRWWSLLWQIFGQACSPVGLGLMDVWQMIVGQGLRQLLWRDNSIYEWTLPVG